MHTRYATLAEVLKERRTSERGITSIGRQEEKRLSYRELYGQALTALAVLQGAGIGPKDEVVIQIEDALDFMKLFWACQLGGMIPVPLTVGNNEEHKLKLARVWSVLRRPCLVGSPEALRQLEKFAEQDERFDGLAAGRERWIATDRLAEKAGEGRVETSQPDDIALIQFSSGSTGDPKGVVLTHENMLCNIGAIVRGAGIAPADVALSWMPLTHDMGLIGFHLTSLAADIPQAIMPPTLFVMDPELWLQKAHEHRATMLTSPNFGYRHFLNHYRPERIREWDLSCLKLLFNGAEPISAALCGQFLDAIAPAGAGRNIMFPVYGMAEASLAVTFPPIGEPLAAVRLDRGRMAIGEQVRELAAGEDGGATFVDVGRPVEGCEVQICDEDGRALSEGTIGRIRIRGRNVTQGYYNNPAETGERLAADGWLDTGDLGFWRGGRLVVTGRRKDVIFVRGQNRYPHDLEEVVQNRLGIELGKVAVCGISSERAGTDDIVAFVVHRGRPEAFAGTALAVRQALNQEAELEIRHVVPVRSIPKTTSGKLQRYKLAESYERGEFAEAIAQIERLLDQRNAGQPEEASADPLERRLSELWAQALGARSVGLDDEFYGAGGDSLKAASLLNRIHREFRVEISPSAMHELSTVRKLAVYIRRAEPGTFAPIPRTEPMADYPVSSAQYRMYAQEQAEGIGTAYHMPVIVHLDGEIDPARAENALRVLIGRYDSLRTCFVEREGEVRQIVRPAEEIAFELERLQAEDGDLRAAMDAFVRPFRFSEAPLFRAALIGGGTDRTAPPRWLALDMHHAVADGISIARAMEQFARLYRGEEPEAPALQYKDYVMWQQERKRSASYEEQRLYWRERIHRGAWPVLELPTDFPRPDKRSFEGDWIPLRLDAPLVRKLNRLAREASVPLNAVLLNLYATALGEYAGQRELAVGSLVAGRHHADLAEVFGLFINYVPLRLETDPGRSFAETLDRNAAAIAEAYRHQEFPYEEMIAELPSRTPQGRNPLFDTMLILHNQMDIGQALDAGGIRLKFDDWRTKTAKLDLKLDVYPDGEDLSCRLEFNTRLFRRETMERLGARFVRLAEIATEAPRAPLRQFELATREERDLVLGSFNRPEALDALHERTLPEWLAAAAAQWPERTAIIAGDREITYAEANGRADALAAELRRRGLGPDRVAAVVAERSPEMLIGILAILKAGGAYLPIAPDYPPERIRYMLEDSGAKLLLTQRKRLSLFVGVPDGENGDANGDAVDDANGNANDDIANVNSNDNGSTDANANLNEDNRIAFAGTIVDLEDEALYAAVSPASDMPAPAAQAGNLAYVIYTSGSTGQPKGVMIEHRAAVNRIRWMQRQYPLGPGDVVLQKTAFTFDVSVWELFWWFFAGAAVCLLEPGGEKDPAAIARTMAERRVTAVHFVPSMLHLYLEHLERPADESGDGAVGWPAELKYVFASGEALPPQQARRFYRLTEAGGSAARLVNLYGPTEAAVDVSYYDCPADVPEDGVPIGRPIDNVQLYVLDAERRLLPVGVPGELHIAGVGLARGYLGRPELTAEKFVDNPFAPDTRMYRTGDRAKWQADGTLVYLGRLDHQVKLRGFRIELGEVEAALLRHEAIAEAVAAVETAPDGSRELGVYTVSGRDVPVAELRTFLGRLLPEYMIPSRYYRIDRMPLTSSGKADRRALDALRLVPLSDSDDAAPGDEWEAQLAALWRTVLNRERIGAGDDFFALGGHSLKATELAHLASRQFRANVTLKDIFAHPTLRQLAAFIRTLARSDYPALARAEARDRYPLSPAQSRLYLLQQFERIGTAYHLPAAFLHEGAIDPERFERALRAVVARHESLRTSFGMEEGEPVQRVHAEAPFAAEFGETTDDAIAERMRAFVRPFDLKRAPLLRAGLYRLPNQRSLLLFDVHHLVSDGVSMATLMRDFEAFYEGRDPGQPKIAYNDYVAWQRELLRSEALREQERYWLAQFADGGPTLDFPTDEPRPSLRSFEGDRFVFRLKAEETAALNRLAAELQMTQYMVLLAVFNLFLARYSGQEDIVVGTPVSGRTHADLRETVGMFVNTLPLRSYPAADKTFRAFAREVRDHALNAFENQDYPFEELVGKLKLSRSLSRNPLFDAVFVMQNMTLPGLSLDGRPLQACELPHTSAKFDLTLEAIPEGDEVVCRFEYDTRLFRRDTVRMWAGHFRQLAKEAAERPDAALGDLRILPQEEIDRLLAAEQAAAVDYPREMTLHRLFKLQADKTPERIAVVCEDERLTYRELDERANRAAHWLRGYGVGADERVVLLMDRGIGMVVAMLAVLKAGGAYVPIDPDYPADRIAYMAADSGARIALTEAWHLDAARPLVPIALDLAEAPASLPADEPPEDVNAAGDLAYVIYTSGTTGRPKGVMLEHRNVVRLLINDRPAYDFGEQDVWSMFHSYCFDISVWEMYGALLFGGKLVVLEKRVVQDPERLLDTLAREKVTVYNQTPSAFYHLIRYELKRDKPELSFRYVIFGGEALKPPLLKAWKERYPRTKLVNMYGITETTVHSTYKEITEREIESGASPIGEAIPTLSCYVLDRHLRPVPRGVAGELYVGGEGVARGYLNRPELTAERFLDNPLRPGERLYRSGDWVRRTADGEMEYLGRIDHQVKIRGFRIELGEIENRLQQHPDISEASVLAVEGAGGEKELRGYIAAGRELEPAELRRHLAAALPDYMIPATYVRLDRLPLTVNGKVDRRALLQLEPQRRSGGDGDAPGSERERQIGELWQEVLGLDRVGAHDNFFDIGGHSLLLLRLHALLERQYPGVVKVTDLFAYPTVASQAAFIEAETARGEARESLRPAALPADFLAARQGPPARATLRRPLEPQLAGRLLRLAAEAQAQPDAVMAAACLHLFAQWTKRAEQNALFVAGDGLAHVVSVDLARYENVAQLVRDVQRAIAAEPGEPAAAVLQSLPPAPEDGVYPLIYRMGRGGANAQLDRQFELSLAFAEENGQLALYCTYDGRKLRKERMAQALQGMAKVLDWLAKPQPREEAEQIAAAREAKAHD